jgi:protein-S-isoprenylcysteine O-methyltransferase Ste14
MAALVVNTYLESTARIQTDRDQQVISTGVYGVVRHPTYLAVLLSALGISLVFSTLYVCLIAVIVGAIIILRTYLEDKMLKERLDGYMEYAQNVRYRLIPGIW